MFSYPQACGSEATGAVWRDDDEQETTFWSRQFRLRHAMTVQDLRRVAKALGIPRLYDLRKKDLIQAIELKLGRQGPKAWDLIDDLFDT